MDASQADRRATTFGALALIAGSALMLAGELIEPSVDWEDRSAVLDVIAAQTALWNISGVVWFVAGLLLLPGLVTAAGVLRRHRPGMGLGAGITAPLVPLAVMLWSLLGLTTHEAFVHPEADRVQMLALWERMEQTALGALPFYLEVIGTVGILVLVGGLWRSRVVKGWAPLATLLGVVIMFSGIPVLGSALLLAGFTGVAMRIMSSDAASAVAREPAVVGV